MSVCWHPEDDTLFYGTSTGRVGKLGMQSSQGPSLLKPCTNKSVYWLCWGPNFHGTSSDPFVLYAVADKTIFVYSAASPDVGMNLKY